MAFEDIGEGAKANVLSGAIATGGNILTAGAEMLFNNYQADKAYERQKELMMMQNDYNSITSQVERIRQAGLNPSAVLSNGNPSTAGSSAPSVKGANSPHVDLSFLATLGTQLAKTKLDEAQADYWQTQANKEKPLAEYAGVLLQNELLKQSNEINMQLQQYDTEKERTEQLRIENDIMALNRDYTETDWIYRLSMYQSSLDLQRQQILDIEFKNNFLNDAEYQEKCSRSYLNWAQGALAQMNKELVAVGIRKEEINIDLLNESYRHALVMNGVTEKYEGARQVMDLVGQGVGMLTDIAGAVAGFINPFAGRKLSREQSRQQYEQFDAELQRKVAKDAQDYYLKQQGKQTLTTYGEGKKLEVTTPIP